MCIRIAHLGSEELHDWSERVESHPSIWVQNLPELRKAGAMFRRAPVYITGAGNEGAKNEKHEEHALMSKTPSTWTPPRRRWSCTRTGSSIRDLRVLACARSSAARTTKS